MSNAGEAAAAARNWDAAEKHFAQMLTEARALSESMGTHGQTRWIDDQLAR